MRALTLWLGALLLGACMGGADSLSVPGELGMGSDGAGAGGAAGPSVVQDPSGDLSLVPGAAGQGGSMLPPPPPTGGAGQGGGGSVGGAGATGGAGSAGAAGAAGSAGAGGAGAAGAGGAGAGGAGGAGGMTSTGVKPFGAMCTAQGECTSGICGDYGNLGRRCTQRCQSGADCPAGSDGCSRRYCRP